MSLAAQWIREWAEYNKYPFHYYKVTASTNENAKSFLKENNRLFIAEFQTRGRGRNKNKWLNSDMMISWSFSVKKPPQPNTSLALGDALHSSLKTAWPSVDFKLKPPNDIYIGAKKAAGFLIEIVSKGDKHQFIIGVGMNIFKHPDNSCFTHLAEYIELEQIQKKHWFAFMSDWHKKILAVLQVYQ